MRGPINVKSPNNITSWQMRFNSAFKGLIVEATRRLYQCMIYTLLHSMTRINRLPSNITEINSEQRNSEVTPIIHVTDMVFFSRFINH
jgi:hypothetical protein